MGSLLVFIIVGLIIGVLARALLPGRDPIGILGTIAVGMIGAVAGGYIWEAMFGDDGSIAWIGSILFAMLLLWIIRKVSYGRSGRTAAL